MDELYLIVETKKGIPSNATHYHVALRPRARILHPPV